MLVYSYILFVHMMCTNIQKIVSTFSYYFCLQLQYILICRNLGLFNNDAVLYYCDLYVYDGLCVHVLMHKDVHKILHKFSSYFSYCCNAFI